MNCMATMFLLQWIRTAALTLCSDKIRFLEVCVLILGSYLEWGWMMEHNTVFLIARTEVEALVGLNIYQK